MNRTCSFIIALFLGATQIVASTLRQWCRIYVINGPGTNGGPFSATRRAGNATIWVAPLFLCAFVFHTNCVFAQANSAVDAKNGFKDFKLGDTKQKWISNLVFEKTVGEMKMYRYEGPCCQQVFDSQVEKILLGFSNQTNKLVVIYITTPHRPYKVLEGYLTHYEDGFKNAFGKPQSTEHEDLPGQNLEQWTYTWYGTNSSIDLRTYYGPVENGEMYSSVYVMDKKFVMGNRSTKTDSGF